MSTGADAVPASSFLSLKRPYSDDEANDPSTPTEDRQQSTASSVLSSPRDLDTPKDTPMASMNLGNITSNSPSKISVPSSISTTSQLLSAPAAKRRKLTAQEQTEKEAEKSRKAAEKEAKMQQKEAELKTKEEERRKKAEEKELERKQKEEERRQKEEEKKAKDEEKQRKAQEKEDEKRKKQQEKEEKLKLKEFEKLQKEEEKERRERSQMRLSSFFNVPTQSPPSALSIGKSTKAGTSPSKLAFITKEQARQRSMSLDPVDSEPLSPLKVKASSNVAKQAKNSMQIPFLPFVLGKNMTLAPNNRFLPTEDELVRINAAMDSYTESPPEPVPSIIETFTRHQTARGYQPPNVQTIVRQLHGSSQDPIDLTTDEDSEPMVLLKSLQMKHLFFWEDVRPHYRGTWTRPVSATLARKLTRNPFTQELTEVNYDYDSEAEWEDAEDGEDIADADDNEEDEEDEEDMDGFIDDDNAPQYLPARKALPVNDVEPICSGLQWENSAGKLQAANPTDEGANFSDLAVCFLLEPSPKTIDPYTTGYWDPEPKQVTSANTIPGQMSLMGPPRPPLQDRTNGSNVQTTLVNGKVPKAAKVGPKLVPADVLPAFKAAIDGQDLTKVAMIEALKKQFPKLTRDQITGTLPIVAERKGAKQAEKRWTLIADAKT